MSSDSKANSRAFSKLKNIELSDGWSFVARRKGNRVNKKKPQPKPVTPNYNAPVDESVVARIIDDIDRISEQFNSSECARIVKSALSNLENEVDLAICAGLGNLDPSSDVDVRRSAHQLGVFFQLVSKVATQTCRIFACDPNFTQTDKAVLEHFKTQVDSQAEPDFGLAMENSFLFAPYLPWPVLTLDYLSKMDSHNAIIVCQDLRNVKENLEMQRGTLVSGTNPSTIEVDGRECTKEDLDKASEICEKVVMGHDAIPFPRYEPIPAAFQDLVVYLLKQTEDHT